MEVVLNESPQLFQPGECPDAALYCGWYSLAKYVDAFDWRPGPSPIILASAEAITLRQPESQVWCKRLLEDGVCATIGPVAEPYLVAFPRPNEFFSLLLEGDRTLVECYYQTKPFNSWMMTLIGDPLYRPFKKPGGPVVTSCTHPHLPQWASPGRSPAVLMHFHVIPETHQAALDQTGDRLRAATQMLSDPLDWPSFQMSQSNRL